MLADGTPVPDASHVHEGVFAVTLPADAGARTTGSRSATRVRRRAGPETIADDPYRYLPTLGEIDLHLIGEGRHEELWQVLGAHVRATAPRGS